MSRRLAQHTMRLCVAVSSVFYEPSIFVTAGGGALPSALFLDLHTSARMQQWSPVHGQSRWIFGLPVFSSQADTP
jgi:hypothetical protein